MFGSAPLEFHWRTCCLWGKHLKHLNSATTHWSTPDGEPGSNTRGDSEWHFVANNFFSDQILFFIDHSFHFQAETLEWTGHLNGLSTQCSTRGWWHHGWHGVVGGNKQLWLTWTTHQQTRTPTNKLTTIPQRIPGRAIIIQGNNQKQVSAVRKMKSEF